MRGVKLAKYERKKKKGSVLYLQTLGEKECFISKL